MQKIMQGVYKSNIVIEEYNCDIKGDAKLSYLLKEIQEIGNKHLANLGITYQTLLDNGYVFMLSKIALKIYQMPKAEQEVVVVTTPQGAKGASMLRKVQFGTLDGELLIDVQTAWLLVEPTQRKILRPKVFEYDLPYDENAPDEINVVKMPILLSENMQKSYIKKVMYNDMDVNNHMNNTIYADVVMDAIDFDIAKTKSVKEIIIYYQKEALFNNEINVLIGKLDENKFAIKGEINNETCFTANIKLQ